VRSDDPFQAPTVPVAIDPGPLDPATPAQRIRARIIDAMMSGTASVVFGLPTIFVLRDTPMSPNAVTLTAVVVATAPLQLYQLWLGASEGTSIGKRMEGIRMVRASDGGRPGFVRALAREWLVPLACGVAGLLGAGAFWGLELLILVGSTADRRTLRDHVAGTRVMTGGWADDV
jgi:uncharacterized RDD family membrane protein YckC